MGIVKYGAKKVKNLNDQFGIDIYPSINFFVPVGCGCTAPTCICDTRCGAMGGHISGH